MQKKGQCYSDCLYLQYNTLLPRQLFNYQVLCLVHKMLYSPHLIPSIFWNYFTPSISIHSYNIRHNKLYLSQVNSQFGGWLLKFKGSQLWNRLPNDLIDITAVESFKNIKAPINVTPYEVIIKLFNGYLAIYIRPYSIAFYYILSRGVALNCTCTASLLSLWYLCMPFILSYYFHQTFNNHTGGQSVSCSSLATWRVSASQQTLRFLSIGSRTVQRLNRSTRGPAFLCH